MTSHTDKGKRAMSKEALPKKKEEEPPAAAAAAAGARIAHWLPLVAIYLVKFKRSKEREQKSQVRIPWAESLKRISYIQTEVRDRRSAGSGTRRKRKNADFRSFGKVRRCSSRSPFILFGSAKIFTSGFLGSIGIERGTCCRRNTTTAGTRIYTLSFKEGVILDARDSLRENEEICRTPGVFCRCV